MSLVLTLAVPPTPVLPWTSLTRVFPSAGANAADGNAFVGWTAASLPRDLVLSFPLQRIQKVQIMWPGGAAASDFELATRPSSRSAWTVRQVVRNHDSLYDAIYLIRRLWTSEALDVDAVGLRIRLLAAEGLMPVQISEVGVEFGDVSTL